jgi:uncharacterized phage protein (TIGR01671 family)
MRELKFRAWDENNKIFHYNFNFIKSGNENNDWIIFISDKQLANSDWIENPYFQKQLKIMQYSEIKDNKKKEIYEGDILSVGQKDCKKINCEVIFKEGCFGILASWIKNEYKFIELRAYLNLECLEIVGNIYENKELLK